MTPPRALFRRSVELLTQILTDPSRPADRQIEWFFKKHRDMGVNDRGFVAEPLTPACGIAGSTARSRRATPLTGLLACYFVGQRLDLLVAAAGRLRARPPRRRRARAAHQARDIATRGDEQPAG